MNNQKDMTIVDVEISAEVWEKLEFYRSIEEGLEDIKAGRCRPADDVIADIRKKYNL